MSTVDRQSAPGGSPSREPADLKLEVEDPDGNRWLLQEVTDRLPGRLDPTTTSFNSAGDLAAALRRAESAHAQHEKRIGRAERTGPAGTPNTSCTNRAARSFLYERFRCDRAGRRSARRALRRGHRRAGPSGCRRRAGAGRRRVLVLGLHPVQVPLASWGGGPGRPRRRRQRRGERRSSVGLARQHGVWLFGCGTGEVAGGSGHRAHPGRGPLAGRGVVDVDGTRHTAEHVVVATGADPFVPPIPGLDGLVGVWGTREATAMKTIPSRLIVLGGGAAGAASHRWSSGSVVGLRAVDRASGHSTRAGPPRHGSDRALRRNGSSCTSESRPRRPRASAATTS